MTDADFKRNEWGLGRECASSFGVVFGDGVPESVGESVVKAGIQDVSCVDAVEWMAKVNPLGSSNAADTVRALHGDEKGVVALEFRVLTRGYVHRIRRVYNLVLAVAQYVGVAMVNIRDRLIYAVVMEGAERPGNTSSRETDILSASLRSLAPDTWEYSESEIKGFRRNDERKLTGLICRKAYLLYPNELNSFAKAKGLLS